MRRHELPTATATLPVPGAAGHSGPRHFQLTVPGWLVHHLAAGGPLENWGLSVGLLLAGVGATAGWWMLRQYRPRRRARVWAGRGSLTAGVVMALLGVAVGVNAYAGYVPTVGAAFALATGAPAARSVAPMGGTRLVVAAAGGAVAVAQQPRAVGQPAGAGGSSVVNLPLPAPTLGMPNGNAYVYLPPGFSPSQRYPVLYLLGGAPGAPSDWLYAGNLQGIADALINRHYVRPFIVVMPRISPQFGVDYEGLNAVHGPQVMTYLTEVVRPAIDARFPTIATRAGRAIAGFSAGADAALNTALHNQGMFSIAGAIDPQGRPGSRANWVLADNPRLIAQNSPIDYIPTIPIPQPMSFYLSAGSHRASGSVPTIAHELGARGQTVVVHDESGLGHTWTDARSDLPYLLQFASQAFGAS